MALTVGAAAPALAWSPDRVVTQAIIVVDVSKSFGKPCESAGKIVQELLTFSYAPHSTLLVLATGDSTTSNEPRLLGRFQLPSNRGMLEGAGRQRKGMQGLPKKIVDVCTNAGQTDISPVFLAIKSGLEEFHNLACEKGVRCLLFAASDGEENTERNIRLALDGSRADLSRLKGTLDNVNVETAICGISETLGWEKEQSGAVRTLTGKRTAERSNRLRKVWGELFKDPARLHIYNFCPPTESSTASIQPNMSTK